MPAMLTSVAFVVCQVSVVDIPLSMEFGFADSDAVGAGGGGGGGGGGGATFFLHAPSRRRALRLSIRTNHFPLDCFTWFLLGPQRSPPRGTRRSYVLFPTPIGLGIVPGECQLLNFASIRQHAPDL